MLCAWSVGQLACGDTPLLTENAVVLQLWTEGGSFLMNRCEVAYNDDDLSDIFCWLGYTYTHTFDYFLRQSCRHAVPHQRTDSLAHVCRKLAAAYTVITSGSFCLVKPGATPRYTAGNAGTDSTIFALAGSGQSWNPGQELRIYDCRSLELVGTAKIKDAAESKDEAALAELNAAFKAAGMREQQVPALTSLCIMHSVLISELITS